MTRRAIATFLIVSFLAVPVFQAKATDLGGSWAQATAFITKEYGLDLVARGIARSLLNKLVSGLITKIQGGGRNGGPAFVQNWRNFQTDAQYRGENVFRSILARTKLCNYFQKDLQNLFGANKIINAPGQNLRVNNFDPYILRANCTLPSNFSITNYQNDFAGNGGWNAWSRLLEPQNNYYGALFGSLDEANKQRALEESGDLNEALAGSGYTSIRDKNCAGTGAGAKCVFMGKIFTPGDLLGKTAAATIDADLQWFVSSDELSEVIISVVTASINRLVNLALSKTADDYDKAPKVDDDETNNFNQCSQLCNNDAQCLQKCAGGVIDWLPDPGEVPPPDGGEGVPPPGEEGPPPGGSGQGNDPGAPSSVDSLNSVVWENANVSGWSATADLSVSFSGNTIDLDYDKADDWPTAFPLDSTTELNANAWIFVWRNGRWVASTWEWMRPRQTKKGTENLYAPAATRGELSNFSAESGDRYGFMVSCLARNSTRNCEERSNIVMVTWP